MLVSASLAYFRKCEWAC